MSIFNQKVEFTFDPFIEHDLDCEVRLVIRDNQNGKFSKIIELKPYERVNYYLTDLGDHNDFKYKYQIKYQNKWVDETNYEYLLPEQITDDGIKYIAYPNNQSSKLVVVFQAINKIPSYSYVRTLKDILATRLYIKDDYGGDKLTRSSFYLGPNKNFYIAKNVIRLIENIRKELNVEKEDVICVGASKGGFAALYMGYRGGYGNIIAGGPQVLLGNYLNRGKYNEDDEKSPFLPKVLHYLSGYVDKESTEWANNILYNVIKKARGHNPNVFIHIGEKEPHKKSHIDPFIKFTDELNKRNIIIDISSYELHSDLAKYFPSYLTSKVNQIINLA